MKKRTITIEVELEVSDSINYIAVSKEGQIFCFMDRPEKHPLGCWSNRWMRVETIKPKVLNYENTRRSVK